MKCENCYHYEACLNSLSGYKVLNNTEGFVCEHYKDKSLIVELPCREGDTVWFHKILQDGKYTIVVEEDKVRRFIVTPIEIFAIISYSHAISCDDFGKTAFLSREEAERALEEREKNG